MIDKRGNFLKKLRIEKNLTQSELANILKYTDSTISKWEQGRGFPTSVETLDKMAELFDVTVEELLQGKRNTKDKNFSISKKNLIFILFLIISSIMLILFICYHLITNEQTIMYGLVTDNSDITINESFLIITKEESVFQIRSIKLKDSTSIKRIALYTYENNKKKYFLEQDGISDIFIKENNTYNEYGFKEMKHKDIYIDFYTKDASIITVKLIKEKMTFEADGPSGMVIERPDVTDFNDFIFQYNCTQTSSTGLECRLSPSAYFLYTTVTGGLNFFFRGKDYLEILDTNLSCDQIYSTRMNDTGEIIEKKLSVENMLDCAVEKCETIEDYSQFLKFLRYKYKMFTGE